MTKLAYTVDEAAEAVSMSRRTIEDALRAANGLPILRHKKLTDAGKKRLIAHADLLDWLDRLPDG